MDTDILVADLINDGQKVVAQLVKNDFEVTVAFWIKDAENSQWYFYVASPLAEGQALAQAYGRLHTLIRRIPPPLWIAPLDVKLIDPANAITQDVLKIHSRFPVPHPRRWDGYKLGALDIEGAYLYPRRVAESKNTLEPIGPIHSHCNETFLLSTNAVTLDSPI